MNTKYALVITTVSNTEEAQLLAKSLLSQCLAACIQTNQIKSYYTWDNEIQESDEQILLIKCREEDFNEIEECIKEHHSYEIPEIIMIPIMKGSLDYIDWMHKVTKK